MRQAQVARAEGFDLRVGVRVISQQLAAETVHDFCEGRADLPGADHADSLADQIETGQPLKPEVPLAGAVVGAVQASVEGEDQRHRMFSDGMGRIGWNAHDVQPQAFCRGQVDMVVTRRTQSDQASAARRQAFEHRCAQVIVNECADHLVTLGQCRCIEAQPCRLEIQFDAARR
ncbi:hypothetical protein D3C81_1672660 [compost metagenome]